MNRNPVAVITGAAAGLGHAASQQLAAQGFDLWLIDRNEAAGDAACRQLAERYPQQRMQFVALDLAEIPAIEAFVATAELPAIDVLLNNAGLFPAFERRSNTRDCELGLAVSLYGHFTLTALLLPCLLAAPAPRVVSVSSIAHASGQIDCADPLLRQHYDAHRAYCSSKLASLLFARELQHQATLHHSPLRSIAAHPGISRTQIGRYDDNPSTRMRHWLIGQATRMAMHFLGQDAWQGAQPLVYAATHKALQGGEFIGPGGWFQFKGPPRKVKPNAAALARSDAGQLWQMAQDYTGQSFNWLTQSAQGAA